MYKNLSKILATYIIFQMLVSVSWAQEVSKESVVVKEELIFPIQDQHVHGSSIVSLPNGDLLVAWFQGSGERTADDVRIMGARVKMTGAPLLNWPIHRICQIAIRYFF